MTKVGEILEQEKLGTLISENLKNIFRFCMSKLYDKQEAEDLTNDIICEILKSAHNLKNDEAFYGFMWKIAENQFRMHIRKKKLVNMPFKDNVMGTYFDFVDEQLMENELLQRLRRELSLLSKNYREVTVAYYIEGQTCSEIAENLNLSLEMVKYYLFKARKQMKEGIDMERKYGEKSYNPGTLKLDFWGGKNYYGNLCDRRLPANIVLCAYEKPLTLKELSIELGVAVPYIEDEIEILMNNGNIIKKIGNKYQTNIVIFSDEYDKKVAKIIKPICEYAAERFYKEFIKIFSQLDKIPIKGGNYNRNCKIWIFSNIALLQAEYFAKDIGRRKFGDYPYLGNNNYGFIYAYDNDYKNHHFNGMCWRCENEEHTAYYSVENYKIIEKSQKWQFRNWDQTSKAMYDAILENDADENNEMLIKLIDEGFISSDNSKLSAKFPVFDEEILNNVYSILEPLSRELCDCIIRICDIACKELIKVVPSSLKEKCGQIAFIHHSLDVMAFIIEIMVEKDYLTLPNNEKTCMFGVIK